MMMDEIKDALEMMDNAPLKPIVTQGVAGLSDEQKTLDPRLMELKIAAVMGNMGYETRTRQEALECNSRVNYSPKLLI